VRKKGGSREGGREKGESKEGERGREEGRGEGEGILPQDLVPPSFLSIPTSGPRALAVAVTCAGTVFLYLLQVLAFSGCGIFPCPSPAPSHPSPSLLMVTALALMPRTGLAVCTLTCKHLLTE
jgi:hypothetical protein